MIQVIIVLAVIGFLMYLLNAYLPMQEPFKKILNIIVVFLVVIWLLGVFGLYTLPVSLK